MGKHKANRERPFKSGNPIYKKAGGGAARKAKNKVKPMKVNLKKLKIGNKEAIEALDKKMSSFREALEAKKVNSSSPESFQKPVATKADASMEETVEELSKL